MNIEMFTETLEILADFLERAKELSPEMFTAIIASAVDEYCMWHHLNPQEDIYGVINKVFADVQKVCGTEELLEGGNTK